MTLLERPFLQHKRDTTVACDVDDFDTDVFLYSFFVYLDENDYVWFSQHPEPRLKVSIEDVNHNLRLVPDEDLYL